VVSSASPSRALQSWLSHGALGAVFTPAVGDPRTATATSEPSCIESYTARAIVYDLHPAFRSPLPEWSYEEEDTCMSYEEEDVCVCFHE